MIKNKNSDVTNKRILYKIRWIPTVTWRRHHIEQDRAQKIHWVSASTVMKGPVPGHTCVIFGMTNSGLANLFGCTCPNCQQISKKSFRLSMGILKSKIRPWGLP